MTVVALKDTGLVRIQCEEAFGAVRSPSSSFSGSLWSRLRSTRSDRDGGYFTLLGLMVDFSSRFYES